MNETLANTRFHGHRVRPTRHAADPLRGARGRLMPTVSPYKRQALTHLLGMTYGNTYCREIRLLIKGMIEGV